MTATSESGVLVARRPYPAVTGPRGHLLYRMLTTTDHKLIGIMYCVACFVFFFAAGLMALFMRAELAAPGLQFLSNEQYNQLFTMHGTAMLLFYATPIVFGFANLVLPLQIGAPDVAFPRLNALSFWLFVCGALIALGGSADFGWTAYIPLSDAAHSPGVGSDLWILGLAVGGLGTILGAVNMITTVVCMRCPGMTMFRMPIFTWNIFVTSILVILIFPLLTAALFALAADRRLGAHVYDAVNGGPVLFQHLFWYFGHPEVYVIALPFFGIITEIIPVFSRKPVFGYATLVYATIAIGALSMAVWAHHMFVTGAVLLPFFSVVTFLIAIPTGIKFFNWLATLWGGKIALNTAMLFSCGFIVNFVFGGITGVALAQVPFDIHVHDTYFVVAHFHYIVYGGTVFVIFGSVYHWYPKFTGRLANETLGRLHFVLTFIGFNLCFAPQHWLGLNGMPRRVAEYDPQFTFINQVSSVGALLMAISTLPFLINMVYSAFAGEKAGDNPWRALTPEWLTSSPPPVENWKGPAPLVTHPYGYGAAPEPQVVSASSP